MICINWDPQIMRIKKCPDWSHLFLIKQITLCPVTKSPHLSPAHSPGCHSYLGCLFTTQGIKARRHLHTGLALKLAGMSADNMQLPIKRFSCSLYCPQPSKLRTHVITNGKKKKKGQLEKHNSKQPMRIFNLTASLGFITFPEKEIAGKK